MADKRMEIWHCIQDRIYCRDRRIKKTPKKTDFSATVFQALREARDHVADHCGFPEQFRGTHLRAFVTDTPNSISEYMLDFTWTTYPNERQWCEGHEDLPEGLKYEVLLACECEQGDLGNPDTNVVSVMEDFIKLVDIHSRIKILVYRVPLNHPKSGFQKVRATIERILSRHSRCIQGESDWLFVGIPWYHKYPDITNVDAEIHTLEFKTNGNPFLKKPLWME